MNLLTDILQNEVYPALGCTEPISCAYAAALAASHLGEDVEKLELRVDPGTYKNGAAVTVPHTDGRRGNLIAAALGAVVAAPDSKLEILAHVKPEHLERAEKMCLAGRCTISCMEHGFDLHIEACVTGNNHTATAVLEGGHTSIKKIERDGKAIVDETPTTSQTGNHDYRKVLKNTDLATLLQHATTMDADTIEFVRRGIEMNDAMADRGLEMKCTAYQLRRMKDNGYLADDVFFRVKSRVAAAVDARMAGVSQPVMTSGGSGNQGIVAILTSYIVGKEMKVDDQRIIESVAVAHLVNAYVKCFVGELSVVCGCAMAAGIAAAVSIVYQQAAIDIHKISLAVSSVIGDLGGLICDGAKPGCAMKSITAVDAAVRAALMALEDYGLTCDEGLVGHTAEESIRNLGRMTVEGMFQVDPTMLKILRDKSPAGQ